MSACTVLVIVRERGSDWENNSRLFDSADETKLVFHRLTLSLSTMGRAKVALNKIEVKAILKAGFTQRRVATTIGV